MACMTLGQEDKAMSRQNTDGLAADGSERCPVNAIAGFHVPDLTNISRNSAASDGVLDVNCVYCGRSGSFTISEVMW